MKKEKGCSYTRMIGGSRIEGKREENDYYPTPPWGTEELLKRETFEGTIWEPACGEGHMSEVFKQYGYEVYSSDLIDRGYGIQEDFFKSTYKANNIITNPPYKDAQKFIEESLLKTDKKVAMLLKLQFLESKVRYDFFKNTPLKKVYVFSERIGMYKNEVREKVQSAICFAWFVWEHGYEGNPQIDWILRGKEHDQI